ncbi:hypothetical protein E2C01_086035 [Portunus trituberculatus]|uniref:Uncharacterized protein n=1 Tax=Portunus trituberculatus TaxID=210409 RepID=A0A5B7J8K9_PORTR|nr:hypothetical protein [Portunus trituberculatus]
MPVHRHSPFLEQRVATTTNYTLVIVSQKKAGTSPCKYREQDIGGLEITPISAQRGDRDTSRPRW